LLVSLGERLKTMDEDTNPDAGPGRDQGPRADPHAGLRSIVRKAAITAAVMLVIVVIYAWRVRVNERVRVLINQAKVEKQKNDFAALSKAEKLYLQALDLQGSNKVAIGSLAEIY